MSSIRKISILLTSIGWFMCIPQVWSQDYFTGITEKEGKYVFSTSTHKYLQVSVLTESLLRFRFSDHKAFPQTLMERYDIVKQVRHTVDSRISEDEKRWEISLGSYRVILDKESGEVNVFDASGNNRCKNLVFQDEEIDPVGFAGCETHFNSLFGEKAGNERIVGDASYDAEQAGTEVEKTMQPFGFSVEIDPRDRFYGFGSAKRGQIEHRGSAARIWVDYQQSEAPVPFLMNTGGYAIFLNTSFINYWDIDQYRANRMYAWGPKGESDLYLILEDQMKDMLSVYTDITGKSHLLPKWCYGLQFQSHIMEDQFDVLDNAVRFRDEGIPCDMYGFEVQWMESIYDFSTHKRWNYKLFRPFWPEFKLDGWPSPAVDILREHLFIKRLENIGFKTSLWLCVDEDLSVREEDKIAEAMGRDTSGKVHWFDHTMQYVDDGIKGFKLDPARTLNEHPDRIYHNGRRDDEMHQIQQVLLTKQLKQTYTEYTGERSYHHYCGGYAGSQHWGAMTSGDNGGGHLALHDMLNLSMSGFLNTSSDVLERVVPMYGAIHFGFFQPWVQINSWAEIFHPWYFTQREKTMLKDYAVLRYRLIPYIYSHILEGAVTGMPLIRTMPLSFPEDTRFANTLDQYMFGSHILVGAFTDTMILPEGTWIDYWTGEKYAGNSEIEVTVPENRGGPLFVKRGAILPMQPDKQWIEDTPEDTLILEIFPDPDQESSFILYEDDGKSNDYLEGDYAITAIKCIPARSGFSIRIDRPEGRYSGQPEIRTCIFQITTEKPRAVFHSGEKLRKDAYGWDEQSGKLEFSTALPLDRTIQVDVKL